MKVSPLSWGNSESCFAYALAYHALGSEQYEDMGVVKIDMCAATMVANGDLPSNSTTVTVFHQAQVYTGEPLFVPSPDATSEDDGTILVVSMNASSHSSASTAGETALLAIDALTMQQVARITAPFPTAFEFHGQYIPR
jgi:carotenoid cleavage dioxygenase-like enzyme